VADFGPLPRARLVFAAIAALAGAACESRDVGNPCPELLGDTDAAAGTGTRVESQEVVEQNVQFPCDELICIATDGRPGYCSKKCRENAGCPAGFECRVIQTIGPSTGVSFAGELFCAWKPCHSPSDCGSKSDFCCVPAPSPEAGAQVKLCAFKEGKCP
jgi:hypothetical protein